MININCHTNIDAAKLLKFPKSLPDRPLIGDLIRSTNSTKNKHIELEVVQCTWVYHEAYCHDDSGWELLVELHLPKGRFQNIQDFEMFLKR